MYDAYIANEQDINELKRACEKKLFTYEDITRDMSKLVKGFKLKCISCKKVCEQEFIIESTNTVVRAHIPVCSVECKTFFLFGNNLI